MNPSRVLFAACLAALLASPAPAQTTQVRVDFGGSTWLTGTQGGVTWNDITDADQGKVHDLVEVGGAATGWRLEFTPGLPFDGTNNSGVVTPAPGSPLEGLGWPSSALRDVLYDAAGPVEFTLSGLDPAATFDLTLVGSRLGVADVRTAEYQASGSRVVQVVLDASNNTTDYVQVRGVQPDPTGRLVVQVQADRTNTNQSGFCYLNALGLDHHAPGTQAPLVAFTRNRLDFSRVEGKPAFSATLDSYTNDGTAPSLALGALDDATGLAPTWLGLPGSVTPGQPFLVTVDGNALAGPGAVSATVTGQATGYAGDAFAVRLVVRPQGGAWNLLYYGNSYSQYNGGVPFLVRDIAADAGLPAPNTVARLVGGMDLSFHRNDPGQAAAIGNSLWLGEEWDFVVLQGHSLEATDPLGNPSAFVADALAIASNVRAHSPDAGVVLYQTWARGQGHSFYQGGAPVFSGPMQMHRQIEGHYRWAVEAMEAAFGPGTARRAAVGETVALHGWDPALYTSDRSHPQPPVSLLAGMTLFSALYQRDVTEVAPDFAGTSSLAGWLRTYGLTAADWDRLAGIAGRVAPPALRRYPGSSDDLLLTTGVNQVGGAGPVKLARNGDRIALVVGSPGGSYVGLPLALFVDSFPTGFPPGPFGPFPEIQFDPAKARLLTWLRQLPATGASLSWPLPPAIPGTSFLFQGLAFGPGRWTGNPRFTTTDGQEVRVR